MALHFLDKALEEIRAGRTKVFEDFDVPDEAIGCGFHEAVRGVLSHHLVIRDGKIANYHPYPPTPWNGSPTDSYGTPGPYEDAVAGTADLRGEPRRTTSAGSTSCARSAASTRACRAACTCTSARGRRSGRSTRRCSAQHARRLRRVPAVDDGAARERVARVDALLQDLEGAIGAVPVDTAIELAQALLDLYGEGLARIVGYIADRDADGELARALASDELVSHLLLLHGLHPVPLETRVREALAEVRPYLESHGGDVELLEIERRRRPSGDARAAATAARRRR